MKKIVLVAGDIMPSLAFVKLHDELTERGHAVESFLGHGKDMVLKYIPSAIVRASAVVIGMSSKPERVEGEILAARESLRRGIPLGLYADTYSVYHRPWFEGVRDKASLLFVINKEEAEDAKTLFPNARIIATGNPMWENFCFPRLTRKESRVELGIMDDQTLIYCPGAKVLMMNAALFINTIEAAHQLTLTGRKPFIAISINLDDPNPPETYNDLVKYSRVPVKVIKIHDFLSTSDIVPGADILVDFCSTTATEAAHQRIPVINFFTEIQLGRLEEIIGTREWEPNRLGVAEAVYGNANDLAKAISRLLAPEGFAPMRQRQEIVYPKPPGRGTAIKKMADAILSAI